MPEDIHARIAARAAFLVSPEGKAEAQARADEMSKRVNVRARNRIAAVAASAPTAKQRVLWLRKLADIPGIAAQGISACSKPQEDGDCSHCCYMGVLVAEADARVIAQATGARMVEPAPDRVLSAEAMAQRTPEEHAAWAVDKFKHVPCTFLKDKRCSIYEHRPIACRLHLSVDRDNLMCRKEAENMEVIPYFNHGGEYAVALMAFGRNGRMADIRDWFPTDERKA